MPGAFLKRVEINIQDHVSVADNRQAVQVVFFSETIPWASGEETGQPLAGVSSAPNPAPADKKKIESVNIHNRATGIAEDVDRIGCPFL